MYAWLDGAILMPKVPGSPWCSITDRLRERDLTMTVDQRAVRVANLAECIERLEVGYCCHRDLSSTNVFIDESGRIYLIDWDSLYHPSLSFQSNTTIGTAGYIAPFTRVSTGKWDARLSWRPCADRYGLAVLVAELLLTGQDHENPNEDGTLFAQSHLQDPRCDFVREQAEILCRLDKTCGCLFLKALYASSFDACPPPGQWKAALHHLLRGRSSSRSATRRRNGGSGEEAIQLKGARYAGLDRRGVRPLSKPCRVTRPRQIAPQRLDRDRTHPAVTCEHCHRSIRIARDKLDALRAKGSPILCSECLHPQLDRWKYEQAVWKQDHPETVCARCGRRFRMRADKRDSLVAVGRSVLCRQCFERKQEARQRLLERQNNYSSWRPRE